MISPKLLALGTEEIKCNSEVELTCGLVLTTIVWAWPVGKAEHLIGKMLKR